MTPEISVIVPVLNEAKYLEATLQTIVNQNTNVNYELIVSDNGSTDGSMDIAKKYADSVLQCDEIGIGAARHFGALQSSKTSKYLLFIDADTHIPGYYYAYLYEIFKTDPDLIAFSTGFKFSERSEQIKFAEKVANKYFIIRDKLRSATLPGFNTAVRRESYFKCGGYRNGFKGGRKLPTSVVEMNFPFAIIRNTFASLSQDLRPKLSIQQFEQ